MMAPEADQVCPTCSLAFCVRHQVVTPPQISCDGRIP